LARLIRCAIVASGTKNPAAICAVVRPPTARSVSAICEAGDSDGWQHRNSSVNVSSRPPGSSISGLGATNSSGEAIVAAFSSRRRRADSLRSRSVSRREPTRISQPRGLSGTPSLGHCWDAASSASWTASSARSKCP
jgi:hypothetical protein